MDSRFPVEARHPLRRPGSAAPGGSCGSSAAFRFFVGIGIEGVEEHLRTSFEPEANAEHGGTNMEIQTIIDVDRS